MIDTSDPGLPARFWSKVDKDGPTMPHMESPCWVWTASVARGYGQVGLGGRRRGVMRAHRVSWVMEHGQIPDGMGVLHRCDNPACVRPSHLFLGTNTENQADKTIKGRQMRGAAVPSAKLDEAAVRAIRADVAAKHPLGDVAARYGISRASACLIANRKRWAHVV